jgi:hypothetical protein
MQGSRGFRGKSRVGLMAAGLLAVAAAQAWAAGLPALDERSFSQGARILSQGTNELAFTFQLPAYSLEPLVIGGRAYTGVSAPGLVPFAGEGEPNLPVFTALLAIPPGGEALLAKVAASAETALEGVRIIPVERVRAVGDGERKLATHDFIEQESLYGGSAVFPRAAAWLGDRGTLRGQEVVRVFVAPFRYDPAKGRLLVTREFTITLSFTGAAGAVGAAAPAEDAWESVYRGTVLNYEQGRRWRLAARRAVGAQMPAQAANQRAKIVVSKTGLHALAFDKVASRGFPAGIPLDQLFIYRDVFANGKPDSLRVDEVAIQIADTDGSGTFSAGDTIEFYARDFYDEYGRRGNEDAYFDRNIYWLSWGGGDHARLASRPGWVDSASPARPTHFPDFIHVERDSSFVDFPPRADMDLFVWTRLRRITPFSLPGIDSTLGTTLVANFVTYYTSPSSELPSRGIITFYMTGPDRVTTEVGKDTASVPSVTTATLAVAPGLLGEHDDRMRFESSLTGVTATPGNVLDWFEILYERKYQADGDVLGFTSGGATGVVEYEITGFTASAIAVYDVSDPLRPAKLDVPPDRIIAAEGGFTLTFRDSLAGPRKYIALALGGVLPVASGDITLREPPRLRQVTADYLIVSHPDFAGALAPLVAKRREQGHTVELATTEEVYDDFGNGMKSDTAIRRFIKQGFYGGGAVFALLVGDANIDHRGVLLNPPPSTPAQFPSDIDYLPSHDVVRFDGKFPNMESRATENWFVTLDSPTDPYPDLYLGRLPVGSAVEAAAVVDKILRFEAYSGSDPWKKRLLLVADDEYQWNLDVFGGEGPDCWSGFDSSFARGCEDAGAVARDLAVVAPDTVKYYLGRCTKDDQPDKRCRSSACCTNTSATQTFTRANCTGQLLAQLNAGALMVNYEGHANRWLLTHENLIVDQQFQTDIRGLSNADRPFIFAGYACWMSDFDYRAEPAFQDAIGEKLVLNAHGGACACFASSSSEEIYRNRFFNSFVISAMFSSLRGIDPQGNAVAARILIGEVTTTALVRFGPADYAQRYILFGDPAMVVDMGPPSIEVAVSGSPVGEGYVFEGAVFDTLDVVSAIKDEEAIMAIAVDRVEGDTATPVPSDSVLTEALVDPGLPRSRSYRTTYRHVPSLGAYSLRISAADYAGKTSTVDLPVRTGSAAFFAGEAPLPKGGTLDVGRVLRVVLERPFDFTASDIEARIDGVLAGQLGGYSTANLEKPGQDRGKRWEVSIKPVLAAGRHVLAVSVAGFPARREFAFVPARFDVTVNGRPLYEHDFVSPDAELEIFAVTDSTITAEDLRVEVDGNPYVVAWAPSASPVGWTGVLLAAALGLEPGDHTLALSAGEIAVTRQFRTSNRLGVIDASVFPNPFSADTYFFYTLTSEATEARLAIYTVSGRKIFDAAVAVHPGYNQYRWDGRDSSGRRIANGTYLYKLTVKAGGAEDEAVGRLVKLD